MYKRPEEGVIRVRVPRGRETFGTVIEMLGASRFRVQGIDGNERICRIPGKFKRNVLVKIGDIVLIEPWTVQADERADIIWRYKPLQVDWLVKRGFLKL